MELENFAEALEALVESGADNYGDGDSIVELHQLQSRFESFVTEATAAFEAGEEWAADGAKTAASWIATRCRVSRAGRQAPGSPRAHAASPARRWRRPGVRVPSGPTRPSAIASARRHRTEASMARDEAMLVAQAAEMGFDDFYRVLEYWKQLADPDGAEASDEERKASRTSSSNRVSSGMWLGQITLDPISGSIVANELNRLEHDLFEADCAAGQRAPGPYGADRRAGPHLGPAPGRRPCRDGDAKPHRPSRWHPARPAVFESSSATRRQIQGVNAKSSASFSDGFMYPSVLRGRSLRLRAN